MAQQIVNDLGSNLDENLERWAKMLRHPGRNRTVFDKIYSSKKANWSNQEIAAATKLDAKAAGEAAKALYDRAVLMRLSGTPIRYSKRADIYREKRKLLTLAGSPKKLAALPTKRRPQGVNPSQPRTRYLTGRAIRISVDDIDSFAAVKKIDREQVPAE